MHKQIVIGFSGQKKSDKALLKRVEEVVDPSSCCYLVHAIEHQSSYGAGMGAMVGVDVIGELEERAISYLEEQKKQLAANKITNIKTIVAVAPAKQLLLEVIEEVKADLVMVGSHAKHGVALLLGSTADAVVHSAECDILAVRI